MLAAVVLGPALGAGSVLLHDMVFVPRQPLAADDLGLGTGLPRAVPVDAVVALATAVVPGQLLQKAVLLAVVAGAALGAAAVVPSASRWARLAAGLAYAWNPWVAERLLVGHWALLVGYAALPWLLRAALAVRAGAPGAVARGLLAAAAGSLTPTGGLLALGVAAAGAGRRRAALPLLAGTALLQAPWVVAGLLHPAGGGSDPAAVAAFAVRGESWAGPLWTALGLGGLWNAQAVPGSRDSPLVPLLVLAGLAVAALGARRLHREWGPAATALAALSAAGLVLALAGVLPGLDVALRAVVEHVPGGGLLRDGHKWLAPLALLLAVLTGLGVERIATVPDRQVLAALALLLPVAGTPDLAWGAAGRLEPVRWPADWAAVAAQVEPGRGSVVSLPFAAYRAYDWNGRRPSLDPAPRRLDADVVVDDRLVVDGTALQGEDLRARAVALALASGEPLGRLGVGWVLVHRGTPGEVPPGALDGARLVHDGEDLQLWRLPGVRPAAAPRPPAVPVVVAHLLALAVVVGAAVALAPLRWRP